MSSHMYTYRLGRFLINIGATLFLRIRVSNIENIPDEGPAILAANHQSFLDPPLVGARTRRILSFMARDTLFKVPLLKTFLPKVNSFPVKRGAADVGSFKQSLRVLKAGGALVLFAEGTRTETGKIADLQPGVIGLARKAKAPIVLVAIEGAFEAWPRTNKLPRPRRVWLDYGEPIYPAAFEGLDNKEAAVMLTRMLRDQHNQLRIRAGRQPFEYADTQPAADAED